MFPFGLVFPVCLVLLFSLAAFVFGLIGGGVLVFAWVVTFAIFFGLLLIEDGHRTLRRAGAGLIAAALLGLALAVGIHPAAAAEALIVAPPGDTLGLWAGLNGWIADAEGAAIVAVVGWVGHFAATRFRLNIKASREASLIETLKTGFFQATHELELVIDDNWTPAQKQKVVDRMTGWAETRATAELKKLGLPSFVVTGIARKVVGQLIAALTHGSLGTVDAGALVPLGLTITGNPGETPSLDRAATGGN